MKLRVWTEVSLQPDALARLKDRTDVVEHGTLETLQGCDVAILGVLYGAGLHRAEAAALDLGDLDAESGSLRWRRSKIGWRCAVTHQDRCSGR